MIAQKAAKNRGYALMMVLGMVALMASTIACLSILTRGRLDDLQLTLDRTTAYYLCESAASIAVLDIRYGNVSTTPPAGFVYNSSEKSVTRTVNITIGSQYGFDTSTARTYPVRYVVTKPSGVWSIKTSVSSPFGAGYRYTLHVGGKRAFPFFIKEMGAGLGGM
ncbi:MAG: hypothetical protein PHW69_06540 [Elusimicrobiaceae bacterium]|nr:hypothetical protein [Elusimicrobiaceae bacterium]